MYKVDVHLPDSKLTPAQQREYPSTTEVTSTSFPTPAAVRKYLKQLFSEGLHVTHHYRPGHLYAPGVTVVTPPHRIVRVHIQPPLPKHA